MDERLCVIGAGAAGLGAMEVLQRRGLDFDCFEQTDRVGGHWHTDYESLHLITSRDLSGFAGHPMPAHYPVYPSRDQMRDYLEGFADETGVRGRVTFGTRVERITPLGSAGSDGWRVETSNGVTRDYAGVVVCNGHLWEPNLPSYPGTFTGQEIHAGVYRSIDDLAGPRVLTVGAGNSGCDLAVDVANARLESTISIRRGQMFQPKAVFGRPRAEIRWLSRLPLRLNERIARALSDVVIGPASAYRGLPEPPTRNLNEQPPVVNNLLPYWIQHGRITARPGIARLDGRRVHFVDGTSGEFDTILWATGFRVSLPFLDADLIRWRDGVPLRTAGLTLPVGAENLHLVGLAAPRGPQLPVYSEQAELVVRMRRLDPARRAALAARFAEQEVPDTRIDIVRAIWQRQMRAAGRTLDALERAKCPTPARTNVHAPRTAP
jgi:cation diffusion facilitator CzcD-associated flavoprotein CzcO